VRLFRRSLMPASAARVYAFHEQPDALLKLIPPWERIVVLVPPRSLEAGTRVVVRQWIGPISVQIESVHQKCEPGRGFIDAMVSGPFRRWVHEHRFEHMSEGSSWLVDDVEYELPMDPISRPVAPLVERRLERLFAWRHEVTRAAVAPATETATP
jgi:ligand-binding SRPBCC domain-containing protein